MTPTHYPALIYEDPDGFEVVFPDLPDSGVATADSLEEAESVAAEALAWIAESMIEDGKSLPTPSSLGAPLPDWLAEEIREPVARVLVPLELPAPSL